MGFSKQREEYFPAPGPDGVEARTGMEVGPENGFQAELCRFEPLELRILSAVLGALERRSCSMLLTCLLGMWEPGAPQR